MITVTRSGEEISVKDAEGKELEGCFCPFAGEMCYEGDVVPEALSARTKGKCQFWDIDYSRCGLFWAISGLKNLDIIATALDSIAKKQGEI